MENGKQQEILNDLLLFFILIIGNSTFIGNGSHILFPILDRQSTIPDQL